MTMNKVCFVMIISILLLHGNESWSISGTVFAEGRIINMVPAHHANHPSHFQTHTPYFKLEEYKFPNPVLKENTFLTQPGDLTGSDEDRTPTTATPSRDSSVETVPHRIGSDRNNYQSNVDQLIEKLRTRRSLPPLEEIRFLTRLPNARLHTSVAANNFVATKKLLENDTNPNTLDETGVSPLEIAVHNGDTKMIRLLLAYGANQNIRIHRGQSTLLHLAIQNGTQENNFNKSMLSILLGLDLKMNPNLRRHKRVPTDLEIINGLDSTGCTPLHVAARRRLAPVISVLLAANADPNIRTESTSRFSVSGKTPLHLVLENTGQDADEQNNALNIIQELFKYKADLDAKDDAGKTPLQLAIDYLFVDIANFLLKNGAILGDYDVGEEPDQTIELERHVRFSMMSSLLRGWAEREMLEREGDTAKPLRHMSLIELKRKVSRGILPQRNMPPV